MGTHTMTHDEETTPHSSPSKSLTFGGAPIIVLEDVTQEETLTTTFTHLYIIARKYFQGLLPSRDALPFAIKNALSVTPTPPMVYEHLLARSDAAILPWYTGDFWAAINSSILAKPSEEAKSKWIAFDRPVQQFASKGLMALSSGQFWLSCPDCFCRSNTSFLFATSDGG